MAEAFEYLFTENYVLNEDSEWELEENPVIIEESEIPIFESDLDDFSTLLNNVSQPSSLGVQTLAWNWTDYAYCVVGSVSPVYLPPYALIAIGQQLKNGQWSAAADTLVNTLVSEAAGVGSQTALKGVLQLLGVASIPALAARLALGASVCAIGQNL